MRRFYLKGHRQSQTSALYILPVCVCVCLCCVLCVCVRVHLCLHVCVFVFVLVIYYSQVIVVESVCLHYSSIGDVTIPTVHLLHTVCV